MKYKYTDTGDIRLEIDACDGTPGEGHPAVHVTVVEERDRRISCIPAEERQAAAQALAGDAYRVVSIAEYAGTELDEACAEIDRLRDALSQTQAAQPDRPEPVDPASVKVGDIVTVEADDGSWTVRGEVDNVDPGSSYPFRVLVPHMHAGGIWPRLGPSNIRILRAAEPEPDPDLVRIVRDVNLLAWDNSEEYVRELERRGVRLVKDGARDE